MGSPVKLYVVTRDFKLYYLIQRDFTFPDYYIIHLFPSSDLDIDDLIVTSSSERHLFPSSSNVVVIDSGSYSPSLLLSLIVRVKNGVSYHDSIVIGIDPGSSIGVSVRAGDTILEEHVISDLELLSSLVTRVVSSFRSKSYIIRIGNGDFDMVVKILNFLIPVLPSFIRIELVDERNTTRIARSFKNRKLDHVAAREISFREGVVLNLGGKKSVSRNDVF